MHSHRQTAFRFLLAFVLFAGCGGAWSDTNGASSSSMSSSVLSSEPAESSLADVVASLDEPDRLNARVVRVIDQTTSLTTLTPSLTALGDKLQTLQQRIMATGPNEASADELLDMQTTIGDQDTSLAQTISRLSNGIGQIEKLLADLDSARVKWETHENLAQQLDASAALRQRIQQVRSDLDLAGQQLRPQRDLLLGLLAQAVDQRARIENLKIDINARRSHLSQALRDAEAEPIWNMFDSRATQISQMKSEWSAQRRLVAAYFQAHGSFVALFAAIVFFGALFLMRAARNIVLDDVTPLPFDMQRCRQVMRRHVWVALLVTLLYVSLSAPRGPIAFYDLIWLFMPLPAAALTATAIGPSLRVSVWAIALSLLVSPFRSLLEFTPDFDRIIMLLQFLIVGAAIAHDMRRMPANAWKPRPRSFLRLIGWLALVGLAIGVYANIVGQIGLATTLRFGVLGTLGFAIVLAAAFFATMGLGLVALRTRAASVFHVVQRRRGSLERALFFVLALLGVLGTVTGSLLAFGLLDTMPGFFGQIMNVHLSIGAVSVSINSLITAILCLLVTYVLMLVVRVLLDDEILPRLHLSDGLPYAISALTRYALGLAGFMFALAAAGIDMTKLTILAGAVGVGVGFGLQNVINNFVSGLILLIERPIHVGDTVEASAASGVVQRIGIRATTIRTFQGGDVIVPNGDLLAKDLLNWTLSNRQRRIDIDIGVGYGSDPEQVQKLLVAAADSQTGILATPAPVALFMGFGDNSLDFRLLAWVFDTDKAGSTASDIRRSILASFNQAGIEIPFPQRDIWLRQTPAAATMEKSVDELSGGSS